jgi:membrane protease YdiL (CAAX protease family)
MLTVGFISRCRTFDVKLFSPPGVIVSVTALEKFLLRHPVLAFLIFSYVISWSIWFAIPAVSGGNWSVVKLLVAIGMGPGIAAVALDRIRGGAAPIGARWWRHFAIVATVVLVLNLTTLLFGDGRTATDFRVAVAPGFSVVSVSAAVVSALVCAFIFASAANSHSPALRSIWQRASLRSWMLVLGLVPLFSLLSLVLTVLTGGEVTPVTEGLSTMAWLGFVTRATLFTFVVVGVGEETGWRGWMLPHLEQRYSPLVSSMFVGLAWAMWHLPLFFNGAYPGGASGILEYLFACPILATLFTWVRQRTGRNLLLMLALHANVNNAPRFIPGAELWPAIATLFVVIVVIRDRMWRREEGDRGLKQS